MKLSHDDLAKIARSLQGATLPPEGRKTLGRYRLTEVLGEGGMGVVFRAVDDELGREVALKVLKTAQTFSASHLERFRREGRHTARLDHPNIVTIYEVGHDGDVPYYTMALIPGKPFQPSSGDLGRRVQILAAVTRAVHHAHQQGVIHRDLKPGNILVDDEGEPHLLDFGLSRALDAPSELTRAGALFGTMGYVSPEQAEGRTQAPDGRADVYALGAILYHILAGHPPFHGSTLGEGVRRLVTEDPPLPPGPPDLVAICMKAIERDPARRYATAGALADDLARFLRQEPISARRLTVAARLYRRVRRRLAALAATSAIAAVLLIAGGTWLRGRSERQTTLRVIREVAEMSLDAALKFRRVGANEKMRDYLPPLQSAYREATEKSPGSAEVDYLMGRMYRALMEEATALEYQERALAKDPGYAPALYERGLLSSNKYGNQLSLAYQQLRDRERNRSTAGAASTSTSLPASGPLSITVAIVESLEAQDAKLRALREAVVRDYLSLEESLRRSPTDAASVGRAKTLAARGTLACHRGAYDEARPLLEDAVKIDPLLEEAWEALALAALAPLTSPPAERLAEMFDEAERWYTQGLSHDRGYLPHWTGRSEVRARRGRLKMSRREEGLPDFRAADEDLGRVLELRPSSAGVWQARGMHRVEYGLYYVRNRYDIWAPGDRPEVWLPLYRGADEDLTAALTLDGTLSKSWGFRGFVRWQLTLDHLTHGRDPGATFAAALEDYAQAIRLEPDYTHAWSDRGHMRAHMAAYFETSGKDRKRAASEYAASAADLTEAFRLKPTMGQQYRDLLARSQQKAQELAPN